MVKVKGYWAIDQQCPRRPCWSPGTFQSRGATMSGSRNTGASSRCCLRNANHGCPDPLPQPKKGAAHG